MTSLLVGSGRFVQRGSHVFIDDTTMLTIYVPPPGFEPPQAAHRSWMIPAEYAGYTCYISFQRPIGLFFPIKVQSHCGVTGGFGAFGASHSFTGLVFRVPSRGRGMGLKPPLKKMCTQHDATVLSL